MTRRRPAIPVAHTEFDAVLAVHARIRAAAAIGQLALALAGAALLLLAEMMGWLP